jgi:hypothetical protein
MYRRDHRTKAKLVLLMEVMVHLSHLRASSTLAKLQGLPYLASIIN